MIVLTVARKGCEQVTVLQFKALKAADEAAKKLTSIPLGGLGQFLEVTDDYDRTLRIMSTDVSQALVSDFDTDVKNQMECVFTQNLEQHRMGAKLQAAARTDPVAALHSSNLGRG